MQKCRSVRLKFLLANGRMMIRFVAVPPDAKNFLSNTALLFFGYFNIIARN
jgi:hypothetical protein